MYKQYRRKTFWIVMTVMTMAAGLTAFAIYFTGQHLAKQSPADQGRALLSDNVPVILSFLQGSQFYQLGIPGIFCFFLISGLIIWACISVLTAGIDTKDVPSKGQPETAGTKKKDFIDQKIEQERRQRLFLHTLSILQREGRLLDFFDEDLNNYDDSQIGAAVRSIQADCKKAVKKYIDLQPVVKGDEGEPITVEEGFDMEAINLVGNVSGHPPFKGIIRHPGWRAGKRDVPKLADVQDPGIMTPAEIEIQ